MTHLFIAKGVLLLSRRAIQTGSFPPTTTQRGPNVSGKKYLDIFLVDTRFLLVQQLHQSVMVPSIVVLGICGNIDGQLLDPLGRRIPELSKSCFFDFQFCHGRFGIRAFCFFAVLRSCFLWLFGQLVFSLLGRGNLGFDCVHNAAEHHRKGHTLDLYRRVSKQKQLIRETHCSRLTSSSVMLFKPRRRAISAHFKLPYPNARRFSASASASLRLHSLSFVFPQVTRRLPASYSSSSPSLSPSETVSDGTPSTRAASSCC